MRTTPRAMKRRCARATSCSPTNGWDEAWLARWNWRWPSMARRSRAARERTVAALDEQLDEAPDDDFARAAIALEGWDGGDLAACFAPIARATPAPGERPKARTATTSPSPTAPSQCPPRDRSTGEQKALLLGLVLAHAELVAERRGEPPILLLDEVAAHLDPKRRAALFARLEGRGQVWMTATEAALFDGIGAASRFRIEPGIAHPE